VRAFMEREIWSYSPTVPSMQKLQVGSKKGGEEMKAALVLIPEKINGLLNDYALNAAERSTR